MTARRDIDLGPVILPAGAGMAGDGAPPREADASDVMRFEALMREGTRAPLLAGGGPDTGEDGTPAQDGVLAAEIERLWVGNGSSGAREVRMGLRHDVLPSTSVRLYESGGCLQVELFVAGPSLAAWMATRAARVARDLGARLAREVCVTVSGGAGREAAELARETWSPGRSA